MVQIGSARLGPTPFAAHLLAGLRVHHVTLFIRITIPDIDLTRLSASDSFFVQASDHPWGSMKILFVASEGLPYSKTGGLADVVEALPKALREMGHDVAVLLPRYRGNKFISTLISSLSIPVGDTVRFPAIVEGQSHGGVRYFVDDPEYFDREHLYGDKSGDYGDNAEALYGVLPCCH